MALLQQHPLAAGIAITYVVMSAATFVLFGVDKSRATKGQWRIRESQLHALELLFGWPGAIAAMAYFKHKRRKLSFVLVTSLIVLLHATAWGFWLSR
jgi:uncharacterized membrane protein YsdA (DUF1294 family)